MGALAVIIGVVLVVTVLADLVNTLVATNTSTSRWWLTRVLYTNAWRAVRRLTALFPNERSRETLIATFAPTSVLLLLMVWVAQQIVGFGLIWWGLGGLNDAGSLFDSIYYSGVVYFTLGFGELVPVETVPRIGALVEAFSGVLTTALVMGYLPSLYSAYSDRERKLMTLDDGSEGRITPTNLLLSRAPDASVDDALRFFEGWEAWIAGVHETHTTFPMLQLFRSKHAGQSWITALGLISDAALQCQLITDAQNRAPYWTLRRAVMLFDELTRHADLGEYRAQLDATYAEADAALDDPDGLFQSMYRQLESHGFKLVPLDEAREETLRLRRLFDAQMEYLIDMLLAPRGFWGHSIGHQLHVPAALAPPP